jgi:hypothetical protein
MLVVGFGGGEGGGSRWRWSLSLLAVHDKLSEEDGLAGLSRRCICAFDGDCGRHWRWRREERIRNDPLESA